MIACSQCHVELVIESIAGARNLRCSACGALNSQDELIGKKMSNRMAWWSLWLGLLSMVFACFAGIPAVYLGIRALLKTRYQPTSNRAKVAAWAGIGLGGPVGTFGVSSILFFAGAITAFVWNMVETENPREIAEIAKAVGRAELSNEFELRKAMSFDSGARSGVFRHVRWSDDSHHWHWLKDGESLAVIGWDESKRSRLLSVTQLPSWMSANRMQMNQMMKDNLLLRRQQVDEQSTEVMSDWNFLGKQANVYKVTYHDEKATEAGTDPELLQYFCMESKGDMSYGMVLVHRPAVTGWGDEDAQKIFASFEPAK